MNKDNLNRVAIRQLVIGIAVTICVVLTSCTKEQLEGDAIIPVGNNIALRFKALVDNSSSEEKVNRVRVVIFGSYQSADREKLIYNQVAPAKENGSIDRILISAGLRDIYLIVNEPSDEKARYDAISTPEELRNMQVLYKKVISTDDAAFAEGLPMFSSYMNQMLTGQSNDFGADGVEYLLAKVTLKIVFTAGGITEVPNVGDVEVTGMRVCNIPDYGTLTPLTYGGKEYHSAPIAYTPTTEDKTTTYTTEFYLPEHLVKSADNKTFVEIKGRNTRTNEVSTWIVKLGDATVTEPKAPANTPYNITRNMHYTVTGTIKSYGEVDVNLEVLIAAWANVTSPNANGDYIFCKTESLELFSLNGNVGNMVEVPFTCGNYKTLSYRTLFGDSRINITYTHDAITGGKLEVKLKDGYVPTAAVDNENFEEITLISASYTKLIKIKYVPDLIVLEGPKSSIAAINGTITVRSTSKNGNWAFVVKDNAGIEYGRSATVTKTGEQSVSMVMEPNIDGAPINYIVSVFDQNNNVETKFNSRLAFRVTHTAGAKLVLLLDGTSDETLETRGGEGRQLALISASGKQFDLFFKYGSLIGIDAKVGVTEDAYGVDDILWSPRTAYTRIPAWDNVPFKDLAPLVNTLDNFKVGQGDPCQLVGLTTADISEKNKNGKVTNGTWKRANKEVFTALSNSKAAAGFGDFVFQGGAALPVTGYRNISGALTKRKSDANNFPHVVYSVYDPTAPNGHSHYCSWHTYYAPPSTFYDVPIGDVGALGKDDAVAAPDARNGLPVRCVRSTK